MTDQETNIAIAEVCGWKPQDVVDIRHDEDGHDYHVWITTEMPDYINDLNAMHEAEKMLPEESRDHYLDTLYELVNPSTLLFDAWNLNTATARQRAEAFLRTLERWKD